MAVPVWLRALSRLFLRAYPTTFRRESGAAYLEAVAHRWLRERERAGAFVAGVRTVLVLVSDTLRSAPVAYADARRGSHWLAAHGRGWSRWVTGAGADARVALRSLRKRPGFAALVVVTLGVGVGANAAVFGALDRVVLRPLPFPGGDRMVYIALRQPRLGWQIAPGEEEVSRWRAGSRTLEWLETYASGSAVWTGEGAAELLEVTVVSADLTAALAVRAVVGRVPSPSDLDPSDPPVVMLSEAFWRRQFGGDAGVIGRTLMLNDTSFTVAGVWPASARLELRRSPDLLRVIAGDALSDDTFGYVLALVRRGATVGDVESELAGLSDVLETNRPGFVPSVNPPYGFLGDGYVEGLWLVFGGVAVLLLVSLANVANLLLNRTLSRAGELGVRRAVGGSASALARLFLVESLVLTGLGAAVAVVVARAAGGALATLVPQGLPVLEGATWDLRVLSYAALLATGCAFVCALAPLAQLRSLDVRGLLSRGEGGRSGGGRSGWSRELLVALQVGLAVVLVTGSALTLRSFNRLMSVDTGMAIERLAQFAIRLPAARYPTPEARSAFWQHVLEAVESLPGVRGVTASGNKLLRYSLHAGVAHMAGEGGPAQRGAFSYASGVRPGFFPVTGVPLLEGRDFAAAETGAVTIVNRAFADRYGESVVGRRLTFDDSTFYRIVGVVGDVAAGGMTEGAGRTQVYMPSPHLRDSYERFIVRTAGDPADLLGAVRARVAELDPDLPFREATTGPQVVRDQTARHRFIAQLLAVFGSLALMLAVTGVYGVVALDVSRRTRDVGIRVALGAGVPQVAGDVLAAGLRPVVAGAAVGAAAAAWAARYVEGVLYRVSALDPLSIAAGTGLLLVAAIAACAIPARRASRIDPMHALRASE